MREAVYLQWQDAADRLSTSTPQDGYIWTPVCAPRSIIVRGRQAVAFPPTAMMKIDREAINRGPAGSVRRNRDLSLPVVIRFPG